MLETGFLNYQIILFLALLILSMARVNSRHVNIESPFYINWALFFTYYNTFSMHTCVSSLHLHLYFIEIV